MDHSEFVFANELGEPFDPDRPTHDFTKRIKAAGLQGITLHALRHSFSTLLLSRGEHLKVVQELLGHSSVFVTMDIYSRVLPGLNDRAVDSFAEQFSDAYNRGRPVPLSGDCRQRVGNSAGLQRSPTTTKASVSGRAEVAEWQTLRT